MRIGSIYEKRIVKISREADREQVSAVAKRHGISEPMIFTLAAALRRRSGES